MTNKNEYLSKVEELEDLKKMGEGGYAMVYKS